MADFTCPEGPKYRRVYGGAVYVAGDDRKQTGWQATVDFIRGDRRYRVTANYSIRNARWYSFLGYVEVNTRRGGKTFRHLRTGPTEQGLISQAKALIRDNPPLD